MMLYNFPNDVVLIVDRYIHRFNYDKCVEEYKHFFVGHWNHHENDFSDCINYETCPLVKRGKLCFKFMDRTNDNFGIRHLIRTKKEEYIYTRNPKKIPLPNNYLNERLDELTSY